MRKIKQLLESTYKRVQLLSRINKYDYRFIPFGVIFLIAAVLLYAEYQSGSYAAAAKYFGIFPMPYFHDLRIWLCGIDAIREGVDPYLIGCYNLKSHFNYPYAWSVFSIFPFITQANLIPIGLVIICSFMLSLYFFIGRCNLFSAIVYTLILASPSFMLAVERCNCDLIIFLILMLALLTDNLRYLSAGFLLFAAVLKLFPVGAFISILNVRKDKFSQHVMIFLAILLAFLAYAWIWKDNLLIVIKMIIPPFGRHSFGLGEIPFVFMQYFSIDSVYMKVLTYSLFVLPSVIAGYFIFKKFRIPDVEHNMYGTAYLMGSGIFLVACIFGFNFEYRLIFLAFTIPQIISWVYTKEWLAAVNLGLTILIVWQSRIEDLLNALHLHRLHYHYISQVLVLLLFIGQLLILYKFIRELYIRHFGGFR